MTENQTAKQIITTFEYIEELATKLPTESLYSDSLYERRELALKLIMAIRYCESLSIADDIYLTKENNYKHEPLLLINRINQIDELCSEYLSWHHEISKILHIVDDQDDSCEEEND